MINEMDNFKSDTQRDFTILVVFIFLVNIMAFLASGINYHYYINYIENILDLMKEV